MTGERGRVFLVRHAESEGNRDRRFSLTPAIQLTDRGRQQARARAAWLQAQTRTTGVVSSPFTRAQQTAAILAEVLQVPVAVEADFRERDYGEFAGQPYDAPRPGFDKDLFFEWRPPGGETLVEVAARAGAALDRIAAAHLQNDVVVVSHGAVMMALWYHTTGSWGPGRVPRNAGVAVVHHQAGRYLHSEIVE